MTRAFSLNHTPHYQTLFSPLQRHFSLDNLRGEFGSLAASECSLIWAALLAQYASPFAVPGLILSPPSFAFPACPYLTVRSRPVAESRTTFMNLFFKGACPLRGTHPCWHISGAHAGRPATSQIPYPLCPSKSLPETEASAPPYQAAPASAALPAP